MLKGKWAFLADRTAVLFIGLGAGALVTASFQSPAEPGATSAAAAAAAAVPPAAAAAPVPRAGVSPNLAIAAASNRNVHVGVFGDSFGDGIWSALHNGLRKDRTVEVHQFSERSTGFTRYRSRNVLDDIRGKLDRRPIDIAVISFGCNDTQGIYENGRGARFMSEDWQRIVGERIDAVVGLLRERGASVYWVGLPRMREPGFDADIQRINQFFAARAQALNVPFIDTLSASVDAQGRYAPYLADPVTGERIMARTNDGIHMTISGYGILVRGLTRDIRQSISQARALAHGQERHRTAKRDG